MSSESETNIILNKANIALSRSQRLVASWLPPPSESTSTDIDTKTDAQLQKEDDEIFTAVPERLGLGAPIPDANANAPTWSRGDVGADEKLRRQLLGKNAKKLGALKQGHMGRGVSLGSQLPTAAAAAGAVKSQEKNQEKDEEEDEEEGRAALVGKGKKRGRNAGSREDARMESTEIEGKSASSAKTSGKGKGKKKATSFLDEVLAERSKKRKKR